MISACFHSWEEEKTRLTYSGGITLFGRYHPSQVAMLCIESHLGRLLSKLHHVLKMLDQPATQR